MWYRNRPAESRKEKGPPMNPPDPRSVSPIRTGRVTSASGPVLVTGGSGHLGANLIRRLLLDGVEVRALAREGSNNTALDGLPVERVHGDLRDPEAMMKATKGCSLVYHCAAKLSTTSGHEQEIFDCNVLGTRNVLRGALSAGVRRVVVTGSFSAVGYDMQNPSRPTSEDVPFYPFHKMMPYECSKAFVETEVLRAAADGLDVLVATSCAILGPHDFKPSRMGRVLRDFANGKMRAYIPGGFEFVSAHDLCEGHLLAMEKGRTGHKYIFSSKFVTVDELMDIYEEVTGERRPFLRLPPPVMAGIAAVTSFVLTRYFPKVPQRLTPGAVRILRLHRRADTSKARDELGFHPTSVKQAVQEAYEWFAGRGEIARPRRTLATAPGEVSPSGADAGAQKVPAADVTADIRRDAAAS